MPISRLPRARLRHNVHEPLLTSHSRTPTDYRLSDPARPLQEQESNVSLFPLVSVQTNMIPALRVSQLFSLSRHSYAQANMYATA